MTKIIVVALKLIVNPNEDLSQYEIQFHNMLAQIYKQLYHNDENAIDFIKLAISSYEGWHHQSLSQQGLLDEPILQGKNLDLL